MNPRCRNRYCYRHIHITDRQFFCCEWIPIPKEGRYETCTCCHSKIEIAGKSEKPTSDRCECSYYTKEEGCPHGDAT